MRTVFDRLRPGLRGALLLLCLLSLSLFLGGVGCRLEKEQRTDGESALSAITESDVIHAFLWKYEAD